MNLLGIRQRAILSRTKQIDGTTYSVMCPLTEEQEKDLDEIERTIVNDKIVTRKSIYIYGEVNINSKDDIDAIKKLNLVSGEGSNIHSNFNYDKGVVTFEDNVKFRLCFDALDWFKYNYCLIGKPKRIIIYECSKDKL